MGLSMYVTIDRKPDIGVEIHNNACGRSVIIMRLRIVESEENEEEQQDDKYNLPHGTKVMKELLMKWANMYRIVCSE